MTTGIYELVFSNSMRYVGKSINIEERWDSHAKSFQLNRAAAKLQHEYNRCGMPMFNILVRCHKDHIDIIEAYLIAKRKPELNTTMVAPITDEEYRILVDNAEYLLMSTVEHVQVLGSRAARIYELEDELEELRKENEELLTEKDHELDHKLLESDVVKNLSDSLLEARKHIEELEEDRELLGNLIRYYETPWYKRLFNSPTKPL